MSRVRPCPSCDEAIDLIDIVDIQIERPRGQPGGDVIHVKCCGACGLGFSDDGVTQAQLDEYYAKLARYGDLSLYSAEVTSSSSLQSEAPWELERAEALAIFVDSFVDVGARVYDVGCSTGTLLELLRRRGFTHLSGCDPLESAVKIAREARNLEVSQGWVGSLDPSAEIDVFILSHVFEHVLELRDAVKQLRSRLVQGGCLVVEVPDASRFADYVHAPYQDFNTEHVNHFSPASLSYLLGQFGFSEERLEQVMIRSGPSHPYPATRGVWRLIGDGRVPARPTSHQITSHVDALRRYAEVSAQIFEKVDARIIEGVGDHSFALWGAGQMAAKILRRPAFPIAQLAFIVDSAPTRQGEQLGAFEVRDPASVPLVEWPAVIVPSSIFAGASIARAVTSLNLPSRIVALCG